MFIARFTDQSTVSLSLQVSLVKTAEKNSLLFDGNSWKINESSY